MQEHVIYHFLNIIQFHYIKPDVSKIHFLKREPIINFMMTSIMLFPSSFTQCTKYKIKY